MKNILITGASHGIGRATALRLAGQGSFFLLNAAKDRDALEQTAQEIRCQNPKAEVETALGSVADRAFVEAMCDGERVRACGGIDTLINCAGVSYVGLVQDMTEDAWREVLDVNLGGVFHTCAAVIPQMLAGGCGRILNVSSVWGSVGASCEAAYSASKGGVDAFTKALAKELAPSHISVNAVACGYIDTRMNAHLSESEKQAIFDEIPSGRAGTAEEAADFIYQILTSPEYLTGQIIRFDGAWC